MPNEQEEIIKKALERKGWTVLHRGWPDFLCVRGDKAFACEVKTQGDNLSQEQKIMHENLIRLGVPCYVAYRPKDVTIKQGREMLTKPIKSYFENKIQNILHDINHDIKWKYREILLQIKTLKKEIDEYSVFMEEEIKTEEIEDR